MEYNARQGQRNYSSVAASVATLCHEPCITLQDNVMQSLSPSPSLSLSSREWAGMFLLLPETLTSTWSGRQGHGRVSAVFRVKTNPPGNQGKKGCRDISTPKKRRRRKGRHWSDNVFRTDAVLSAIGGGPRGRQGAALGGSQRFRFSRLPPQSFAQAKAARFDDALTGSRSSFILDCQTAKCSYSQSSESPFCLWD